MLISEALSLPDILWAIKSNWLARVIVSDGSSLIPESRSEENVLNWDLEVCNRPLMSMTGRTGFSGKDIAKSHGAYLTDAESPLGISQ